MCACVYACICIAQGPAMISRTLLHPGQRCAVVSRALDGIPDSRSSYSSSGPRRTVINDDALLLGPKGKPSTPSGSREPGKLILPNQGGESAKKRIVLPDNVAPSASNSTIRLDQQQHNKWVVRRWAGCWLPPGALEVRLPASYKSL